MHPNPHWNPLQNAAEATPAELIAHWQPTQRIPHVAPTQSCAHLNPVQSCAQLTAMHGAPSTTVGALDGGGVGLTVGDAGGDLLVDEGVVETWWVKWTRP